MEGEREDGKYRNGGNNEGKSKVKKKKREIEKGREREGNLVRWNEVEVTNEGEKRRKESASAIVAKRRSSQNLRRSFFTKPGLPEPDL